MKKKESGNGIESIKTIERDVVLSGLTPILFDRYPGNNTEQLEVMDKIYRGKLPSAKADGFPSELKHHAQH
jgi:phosphoribosylaminoimidazole (AIR) synthetase